MMIAGFARPAMPRARSPATDDGRVDSASSGLPQRAERLPPLPTDANDAVYAPRADGYGR